MKWKEKRVLVTGAGGFIGSHLVDELLKKGAEVTAFVHYNARNDWGMLEGRYDDKTLNLNVIAGDITDSLFVKKTVTGIEYPLHFPALSPLLTIPWQMSDNTRIRLTTDRNPHISLKESLSDMLKAARSNSSYTQRSPP